MEKGSGDIAKIYEKIVVIRIQCLLTALYANSYVFGGVNIQIEQVLSTVVLA